MCEIVDAGKRMNLLIVDDEKSAIEAVLKEVRWEMLPFEERYTAGSMAEAVRRMSESKVDVLLCDIEMPQGSGLELLEWVNENRPGICCVFMTCHADFSFAQRALSLGSMEYILKPLDFEKLTGTLKRGAQKVASDRTLHQVARNYLEEGKQALEKQFWSDLYIGEIAGSRHNLAAYLKRIGLDISVDASYQAVLVSPGILPEELPGKDRKLYGFALRNVTEEIFRKLPSHLVLLPFSEEKLLVVITLQNEEEGRKMEELLSSRARELIETAEKYLHLSVCCYAGEVSGMEDIPEQIEKLFVADFDNIFFAREFLYADRPLAMEESFRYGQAAEEIMERHGDNPADALMEVRSFLAENGAGLFPDRDFLRQFFLGMRYLLKEYTKRQGVFLRDVIDWKKNRTLLIRSGDSVENLIEWLDYMIELSRNFVFLREETGRYSAVDQMKAYVEEHLGDELQVEILAEQVHLNADYLNRIFKKETGMSLSRFVIWRKMERAKWLLHHTDWRLAEVAAAVGYYNYYSFTRSFSKTVGMAPQEWKARQNHGT